MTFKDVRVLIDKSVNAWVDDYAPSMGAAIAYYALFSIAPLLILAISLGGLVFGEDAARGQIVIQLQGQIGFDAASVLQTLVKSASKPAHGVVASAVSLFTLLIGASSVFGELQSALNRIWRVPDPSQRSGIFDFLRGRILSFAMVLGIGVLFLGSLGFSAFLSAVGEWSNHWFSGRQTLLQVANFVLSLALNAMLFAMIYKTMPRARIAWRDVGIGAMVTALLFEISKLLSALYLGRSAVGSGFGPAGSLVVFLVWVYLSAQIFLLGAEFTWVYSHQRGSRAERFATKVVPLVPTRSGDVTPEAKAEATRRPPSYPATTKVASAVGRFATRKPLVSVGILAVIGLVVLGFSARTARESEQRP